MIYLMLFYRFFIIGLFTFGGGYAMIPLIKDTVLNNNWLTELEFTNFIGVCESTPGPIAVNMATYIGSVQGGIFGSVCATLGVVLPSFIIILLIIIILNKLIQNIHFKNSMKGVKPVIFALILSTGLLLLIQCVGINISSFEVNFNFISTLIFVLISIIYLVTTKIFKRKIPSIFLILLSAILGVVFSIILN